jgi:hypothetical protein
LAELASLYRRKCRANQARDAGSKRGCVERFLACLLH